MTLLLGNYFMHFMLELQMIISDFMNHFFSSNNIIYKKPVIVWWSNSLLLQD
jgi:hypothetical protein